MNYTRFEELRRKSCDDFERRLDQARARPQELDYENLEQIAFRYRQLLHDHALAAARYPGTAIARRLERLVLAGTLYLQRDPGAHLPSLRQFMTHTFPRAMHRITPLIALMAALFVLTGIFGFGLATVEPSMGMSFLPAEAIESLEEGTLWTESIFSVTPASEASTKIATNNMSVLAMAWAGGALAGIGALWVVFLNGLMLGTVVATTAHYSKAGDLLEFVAAHGPLEISLILISAGAGLAMGKAFVIADDRPRAEILRDAGRDALAVLLGCLPWILLLGFVEGYVSPSPQIAVPFKVGLGLLLEALFITVAWNPSALDTVSPPLKSPQGDI